MAALSLLGSLSTLIHFVLGMVLLFAIRGRHGELKRGGSAKRAGRSGWNKKWIDASINKSKP